MEYELKRLEELVGQATVNKNTLAEELVPETWKKETERILSAVHKSILSMQMETQITYYIQWHQDGLIKLSDRIFDNLGHRSKTCPALLMVLDLLFEFKGAFSKDFDVSRHIPIALLNTHSDILASSDKLTKHFQDSGIQKNLVEIILLPLADFKKQDPKIAISFGRYQYISQYISELLNVNFARADNAEREQIVMSVLIQLNYNHIRFLGYFSDRVLQAVNNTEDSLEKLNILAGYKKMLKQIPVYKDLCYDPKLDPIQKQLIIWLDEEIEYWNNIQIDSDKSEEKLPALGLNLSVAQMAYLTSLFYKHGIFQQPIKARIIETITQTFSSKETEKISPASFTARFQRPNDSSVRSIRKLLKGMVEDADAFLN